MASLLYLLPLYAQGLYFANTFILVRNRCWPIWAIIKEFNKINESTQNIRVCSLANTTYVNIKFKIKMTNSWLRSQCCVLKAACILRHWVNPCHSHIRNHSKHSGPSRVKNTLRIIETTAISTRSLYKMASDLFGWELNYRLVERDITKKEDVLIALTHWCLIKFGFKCIGLGDSVSQWLEFVSKQCTPTVNHD